MLSLRKSPPNAIRNLFAAQAGLSFTYSAAGATKRTPPAGYSVDHTRVQLGARAVGLWSTNVARIVYTCDETGPIRRFGFAYGTVPAHIESGEERFLIEWATRHGSVYYDILAFSRPRHLLAKLGYPMVRAEQRRFGRESATAMQRFVRAQAEVAVVRT